MLSSLNLPYDKLLRKRSSVSKRVSYVARRIGLRDMQTMWPVWMCRIVQVLDVKLFLYVQFYFWVSVLQLLRFHFGLAKVFCAAWVQMVATLIFIEFWIQNNAKVYNVSFLFLKNPVVVEFEKGFPDSMAQLPFDDLFVLKRMLPFHNEAWDFAMASLSFRSCGCPEYSCFHIQTWLNNETFFKFLNISVLPFIILWEISRHLTAVN